VATVKLSELLIRQAIDLCEPAIQDVVEAWMRTPEGKRAVGDVLSELLVDVILPSTADEATLLEDVLVGMVRRSARSPRLAERLALALSDGAEADGVA
jgi:hypothetical protein